MEKGQKKGEKTEDFSAVCLKGDKTVDNNDMYPSGTAAGNPGRK